MAYRGVTRARDTLKVGLTRYPRIYDSTRVPYALLRYALRVPHERDYDGFALLPKRDGMFLDVGANAGMSALSFRIHNRTTPIVSIEPNVLHSRDLALVSHFAQPHEFRICAAGEHDAWLNLYVPIYRGVPLTTEASLCREDVAQSVSLRDRLGHRMDGPDFTIVTQCVRVCRLDSFGFRPGYIKLDVQGSEFAALCGLRETIKRYAPFLLIEAPDKQVIDLLKEFGYAPNVYDRAGRTLRPGTNSANVFFLA
jgi:FkbM family methyltransferase